MGFLRTFQNLCAERGESPSTVCMKVGLSNAAYSAWDANSVPRMNTLIKLSTYFGVTPEYLLGREDDMPPKGVETEVWEAIKADPDKLEAAKMIQGMNTEQLKAVIALLRTFGK